MARSGTESDVHVLQPGWRYAKGHGGAIAIGPFLQVRLVKPLPYELPLRTRPKEEWIAISGYEGIYEVSDMGRVRRIHPFIRGIKPWRGRKGRPRVDLSKNSTKKHWYVYDLVLTAFVGPRPDYPRHFACHINDDPWDNRLTNLVWGTQSLNEKHKRINMKKQTVENLYQWDKSYQLTDEQLHEIWERSEDDLFELACEFNVPSDTIQLIRWNMAMLRVPLEKPEVLRRSDARLLEKVPF